MNGEEFSIGQVITFILLAIFGTGGAIASIWGLVKWIVPKFVEARLTEQKDAREHRQKMDALQTEYLKAEAETTYQMMGSLLEKSQEKEEKANDFIRTTVFSEVREVSRRLARLESRQRLLSNLITGGKVVEDDEPIGDYEAWIKSKVESENPKPPIQPAETGGDRE